MGKKGSWLSAVKKALTPEYREKKDKKSGKSKKYWFAKQKSLDESFAPKETAVTIPSPPSPPPFSTPPRDEPENEQIACEEAAIVASQDAAEVVELTNSASPGSCKLREETAAIKIQSAFRGYLARRALRALRGLVRLKSLIQGNSVKRQATTTLKCMQTLARVQSQIRAQRIRMSEENQALQRQLTQKREKELEKLRALMGEVWVGSTQSKEQMEASLQHKQEAAMRRERALAYAYSHQQMRRSSSKPSNPTYMEPTNPHCGWSWLERWMAARPWENTSTIDRELNSDHASVRSVTSRAIAVSEISKAHSFRDTKPSPTAQKQNLPASCQSPSSPLLKAPTSADGKMKFGSPKGRVNGLDDDSKSTLSIQSEQQTRRYTMGGSSIRDDYSLASSPVVPSYMAATHCARAKSATPKTKLPSPLGADKNGTPREKGSINSSKIKKTLSFPAAGSSQHSVPPKVESSPAKDISVRS